MLDMEAIETTLEVPFLDLRSVNGPIASEFLRRAAEIVDAGSFTNGSDVNAFELAWAEYCGTAECIGTASGLDALRIALIAVGIEPGDEVLVPAATFVATFEAVEQVGATPVPIDCSDIDDAMDVGNAAALVGAHTRAILPVHLYGQLADMRALLGLASEHDLQVVEDACQAHGAARDGLRAGCGSAAAFSFYPGKNLGAFGDAGAIVTNDATVAATARAIREHGQRSKYVHDLLGYTARLDTLQAAALLLKLRSLDACTAQRREAAAYYRAHLSDLGDLELPPEPLGSEPVWHLYVVRSRRRDALASHLAAHGVATGLHYPEPPHLSRAFAYLGYQRGDFPYAERLSREALSLPMFPGITERQLAHVCASVRRFFGG